MSVVRNLLLFIVGCVFAWSNGYSQTASRVYISSITPSINTGQNYSAWLNDDVTNLVPNVWTSPNMQYVDVKLKLQAKTNVSQLSLYDYEGVFTSTPATIYAVNGTTRTLLGTFYGYQYMAWVNINLSTPVLADTIVVHKYGNCIPEKIEIFGYPVATSVAAIGGNSVVCQGATMALTDATSGGTWSSSNTAVATVSSTGVVSGVAGGTANITYNVSGAVATKAVTVSPSPSSGTISGASSVAVGATTAFSSTVTGGTWSSSSATVASVGSTSGVVTGVAAGSATINYAVTNSCGTSWATKVVTVTPAASAGTISGTATACVGSTTALTSSGSGGAWSSSSTGIATVSGSGVVTGVAAGTATISYTVGSSVATKIVTINALPSAGTISGTATVTAGSTTALTASVTGGTWSSSSTGVATVSTSGVVAGVAAGTTTISYVVSNSCGTATATKVVTVNAAPATSAGTITGTGTVCTSATTALSDATTGGAWSSSNTAVASVSASGVVTGVAAGTATISYTVGSAVATKIVTVNAFPAAGTISGAATVAAGSTAAFSSTITGGTWSSTSTAVASIGSSSGMVTGVAAGTAVINYAMTNSCGTSWATKGVTVNAAPASSAGTITGTGTVCTGATTALSDATTGGAWSSSNTAVASVNTSGVVTGVAAGTATISYTVGTAVATMVVTVNAAPSAGTISGTATVTAGSTAALTASVTGGTWSSSSTGVATVSTSGVVTGLAAGTATISYVVSNSCGTATATKVVTVNAAPASSAGTITGTGTVCTGATTALSDATTGGAWSSSNTAVASVNTSGVVTGVAAGTATISYTVGTAVATMVVTVNAAPSAGTISGTATATAGSTTALTASVTGGTWSSSATGIATVSTSGVVTGVAAGSAVISYAVSNSCGTAYATMPVTITVASSSSGSGSGSTSGGTLTYGKIPMDGNRWYQMNNCANGLQALHDGILNTAVSTGSGKILTQFDAYYPVLPGEVINIDSLRFYDGAGTNETQPFTLYYIDSLWNRVAIGTFIGTQYNMWVGPNASTPTNKALAVPAHNIRYLVINSYSIYPNEMELYGSYIAPTPLAPLPAKTIAFKQELGVNAFEWDFLNPSNPLITDETRMSAIKSFGCIRHYLDWQKLEPNAGGYTFNPSHSGGWNLDTIYARAKTEGIEMLVDIKTIPTWLESTYPSGSQDAENVPISAPGLDFTDPNSYLKQAKLGFQFAARYGSNASVSSSLLSVDASTRWTGDPANVVKIGLNLVKYIECDNERDKWWKGRKAYQTGREYAANLSAFYDGNMGAMGAGVGVKNADPNMQVVMGGTALASTDYVRGMVDWCKEKRGYRADGSVNLCWDVINYHIYPNNAGSVQGAGTSGAAPEVAHADTFAANFVNAAHAYAQDMPVWVTETGYDINQGSPVKAIAIGAKSVKQTQADWTLRSSLLYARMGVERTFFYMLDDVDTTSATQFSSCGFVYPNYSRKPNADYIRQAKTLLGDYVYKETISVNPLVDRYELAGQSIYVVVKPTQTGSTMSYSLPLPFASGGAKIYTPTIGQDTMSVSTATFTGSALTVTAGETPIFIRAAAGGVPTGKMAEATDVLPSQTQVTIYPNPTSGVFHLDIENDMEGNVPVTVYTMSGAVCKSYKFDKVGSRSSQTLDISNLPNGMYFLEVGQGSYKTVKKVIKVN